MRPRSSRHHRDDVEVGRPRRRIVAHESHQPLRNIAIIALVALAVAFIPGGSDTAELVLAIISLAFLAAIGFLGYRLYMENKFTLWSMSDRHRALLYGGVAVAFMTLVATDRLLGSGLGTILWFALLARLGARRLQRLGRVAPLQDLGARSRMSARLRPFCDVACADASHRACA